MQKASSTILIKLTINDMKLEKLLTLSQFIDAVDAFPLKGVCQFHSIKDYNNFLKQPLIKEMFVNELKEPKITDQDYYPNFNNNLQLWQEAEKKVIFTGGFEAYTFNGNSDFTFNDIRIFFNVYGGVKLGRIDESPIWNVTLNDLAEATNGELTIKNILI